MPRRPRTQRDESGQALVEFSLCLTLLMTVLFGVFQLGITLSNYIDVAEASRTCAHTAARSGAATPTGSSDFADATSRATTAATTAAPNVSGLTVAVSATTTFQAGNGVRCVVTAPYDVNLIGLTILGGTMHSTTEMMITERVV